MENRYLRILLNMIDDEKKNDITNYINTVKNEDYKVITVSELDTFFQNDILSYDDSETLKYYSGYYYKYINSVKRGIWDYDYLGKDDNKDYYKNKGNELSNIIMNKGNVVNENFMTYRGVNIGYFNNYGINSLNDLLQLKNYFFIDRGFVSTSPIKDRCYFQRENELNLNYNVLIEYCIPKYFNEGLYLGNGEESYSPHQCEYLIKDDTLSYVSDVYVNDNTAKIKMIVIPVYLYDDYYKNHPRNVEINNGKSR